MDRQRIEGLHEKASQHYLTGDFLEAFRAWQALLELDPHDERAREGVRLARLLSETAESEIPKPKTGAQDEFQAGAPGVLGDLDFDLSILDGPVTPAPSASAATSPVVAPSGPALAPELSREGLGTDLGDLGDVASVPLAAADQRFAIPPTAWERLLEADESDSVEVVETEGDPGEEAVALAPFERAAVPSPRGPAETKQTPTDDPPVDAATAELGRRVADLFREAQAAAAEGRREDALGVVARLFVLDEEHQGGRTLEASLQAEIRKAGQEVENWIIEGVQSFEHGRYEEARSAFQHVLERIPGHAEASDYLERITDAAARARTIAPVGVPDLDVGLYGDPLGGGALGAEGGSTAQVRWTESSAIPLAVTVPSPGGEQRGPRPSSPVTTVPRARGRGRLLWLGGVLVVGVSAAVLVPRLLEGDSPSETTHSGQTPPRAPGSSSERDRSQDQPAPAAGVPAAMERGKEAMGAGDYAAAVLAFNEALSADPDHAEARAALLEAGQRYRAEREVAEQIARVERAFADGEYTGALKILYRLPREVDRNLVTEYQSRAWYNLGVVALKAGDCPEAIGHFDEVLAIRDDAQARGLRAFAERSRDFKDHGYYVEVEALSFRGLEDSVLTGNVSGGSGGGR